jgi:hypothetical protein
MADYLFAQKSGFRLANVILEVARRQIVSVARLGAVPDESGASLGLRRVTWRSSELRRPACCLRSDTSPKL